MFLIAQEEQNYATCYERDFFSPLFVFLSLLCFIFSHLTMSFSLADDFSLLFSLGLKLGS